MNWFGPSGNCGCCDCDPNVCRDCNEAGNGIIYGLLVVELEWDVDSFYEFPGGFDCLYKSYKYTGFSGGTFSVEVESGCSEGQLLLKAGLSIPSGAGYYWDDDLADWVYDREIRIIAGIPSSSPFNINMLELVMEIQRQPPFSTPIAFAQKFACSEVKEMIIESAHGTALEHQDCEFWGTNPIGTMRWHFECL